MSVAPVTIIRGRKKVTLTAEEFKTYVGRTDCPQCDRPFTPGSKHKCTDQPISRRTRHLDYRPQGDGVEASFTCR